MRRYQKQNKIYRMQPWKISLWEILNYLILSYTIEKNIKWSMVTAQKIMFLKFRESPKSIYSWYSNVVPLSFHKYFIPLIDLRWTIQFLYFILQWGISVFHMKYSISEVLPWGFYLFYRDFHIQNYFCLYFSTILFLKTYFIFDLLPSLHFSFSFLCN